MIRTHQTLVLTLMAALLLAPAGLCAPSTPTKKRLPSLSKEGDELVRRIAALIRHYHVETQSERELVYAACEGLTKQLDPYSVFLRPQKAKALKVETSGQFSGIGVKLTVDGEWLSVIAPIEGSPAFTAGIRAGDIIIKLAGKSTKFMSLAEATALIRGTKGSSITLSVYHLDDEEPSSYTIVRDDVQVQTIADSLLIDGTTGYIRLIQFKRNSAAELRESISELREQGMTNLILDLRANPGGVLQSAVDIADIFLAEGVIVSTKKRHSSKVSKAQPERTIGAEELKLALLINKSSASAAEILAGAIKDHKRGQIIGETSFGKGSVQSIFKLPNLTDDPNGAPGLKLTTAHYLTPAGTNINNLGILPTIDVAMSRQTQVELARLRSQRYSATAALGVAPMPPGISKLFPDNAKKDTLTDNQLCAAIYYFRELQKK